MSEKNVKRRKPMTIKRASRFVLSLVILITSGFLINTSFQAWNKVSQNKQDINILEQELLTLQQEAENLEGVKSKLSNPNYVQNYARGKHLMTKSGEQVFVLPKAKE